MDSSSISHDFRPFFVVHNDGRVERLLGGPYVPSSDEPTAVVRSKDFVISPEVSVRIYLPTDTNTGRKKRPVVVYVHGGAFCIESAYSATYHRYVNSLVADADVVVVSVEYRLAPENPVTACYDDTWTALQWVALHGDGQGPDPWLNEFADLGRTFFAGDSAGANIVHDMAIRAGPTGLGPGCSLAGIVLIHPFFGDNKPNRLWEFLSKETGRLDDPRLNPMSDPEVMKRVGCGRVLVCVGEKDFLVERGRDYYNALGKSEWGGTVEIEVSEGEGHVFHLLNPDCDKSKVLMKRVVSFINEK